MRTLVLNKMWVPIKHVGWKRAFSLVFKGNAEILESYDEIIKTPGDFFFIPAVIRLTSYDKIPKTKVTYSKRAILDRDKYTCQYCGIKLNGSTATIDHVIPRHLGGKTNFENTVAACFPCNNKKGARLIDDMKFKLKAAPRRPQIVTYELDMPGTINEEWLDYIPKGMIDGFKTDNRT